MDSEAIGGSSALSVELRTILLELARREDDCAATEAAAQPYWQVCPPSVSGHRAAAAALRDRADQIATVIGMVVLRVGGDGE